MRIEKIYRYPVKGLSAEAMEAVALTPGEMLAHDRRFALAQGDAPFDVAAPRWLSKRNFGCLMANERLALLHTAFDPAPPAPRPFWAIRGRRKARSPSPPISPPFLAPKRGANPALSKRPAIAFPMWR